MYKFLVLSSVLSEVPFIKFTDYCLTFLTHYMLINYANFICNIVLYMILEYVD